MMSQNQSDSSANGQREQQTSGAGSSEEDGHKLRLLNPERAQLEALGSLKPETVEGEAVLIGAVPGWR